LGNVSNAEAAPLRADAAPCHRAERCAEVGCGGVVDEVGDDAESGLGDDLDDLRSGLAGRTHGLDVAGFDMAARFGILLGELPRRLSLRVGGLAVAIALHVLWAQAIHLAGLGDETMRCSVSAHN
jgi:hypothetical protein